MRPRVFPAEDRRRDPHLGARVVAASMRPRVFPAEDALVEQVAADAAPLQ